MTISITASSQFQAKIRQYKDIPKKYRLALAPVLLEHRGLPEKQNWYYIDPKKADASDVIDDVNQLVKTGGALFIPAKTSYDALRKEPRERSYFMEVASSFIKQFGKTSLHRRYLQQAEVPSRKPESPQRTVGRLFWFSV
jgi:hypothetical protein